MYIMNNGEINWGYNIWTQTTKKWEKIFNQDLDEDEDIFDPDNITMDNNVTTDTHGVTMSRKGNDLYIIDDGKTILVVDYEGSEEGARIEYQDSFDNFTITAIAVEKTTNEDYNKRYILAFKRKEIHGDQSVGYGEDSTTPETTEETYTSWSIYYCSETGVINWDETVWNVPDIRGYETFFNLDFNEDGITGLPPLVAENFTDVDTDTVNDTIKMDPNTGYVSIIPESNEMTEDGKKQDPIYLKYDGILLSATSNEESEGDWSFIMRPYAVKKTLSTNSKEIYSMLIKNQDFYTTNGNKEEMGTSYEIYKITVNSDNPFEGEVSIETGVWIENINFYETTFDQDFDSSGGSLGSIVITNRTTDTDGIKLGKGSDGLLYIYNDDDVKIAITDNWIESTWNEYNSIAKAVSNLITDEDGDKYYKLAVKQTDSIDGNDYVNWQIYAIMEDGSINWRKTIWTQGISNYETEFNQDLDDDKVEGINSDALTTVESDKGNYILKQDSNKGLYIIFSSKDDSEINNTSEVLPIKDEWGSMVTFDHEYIHDSSHKSESIAVEKTVDNRYILAIKKTNTNGSETDINWEIIYISSEGIIDWDSTIWTENIKPYETVFGHDLDGDGSTGIDISKLTEVVTDKGIHVLKKDNDNKFYIVNTKSSDFLQILDSWGGAPELEYSDGSYNDVAYAVAPKKNGDEIVGYIIAKKNTDIYNDIITNTTWDIYHIDNKGILDWDRTKWGVSVKHKEKEFGQDLDGDGIKGVPKTIGNFITTDTIGDRIKIDSQGSLYFIDDKDTEVTDDDEIFALVDEWGSSPDLNWEYSDENGSDKTEVFAIESYMDGSDKKFKLVVKRTYSYYGNENVSWDTYVIKKVKDKWVFTWNESTFGSGLGNLEKIFKQDLGGDGKIFDPDNIETYENVDTDKTTNDELKLGGTHAKLIKDSENNYYISYGTNIIPIINEWGGLENLNYSWVDETQSGSTEMIAVERRPAENNFALALKYTYKDGIDEVIYEHTNWETITIDNNGNIKYNNKEYTLDSKTLEESFNQDLDGDGKIFSFSKMVNNLVRHKNDDSGAVFYLDENKNLYISESKDSQKKAVMSDGYPVSFNYTKGFDGWTNIKEVLAVRKCKYNSSEDFNGYQAIIKETQTSGSEQSYISYETIIINKESMEVEWTRINFLPNTNNVETNFGQDLDGDKTIEGNSLTAAELTSNDLVENIGSAHLYRTSTNLLFIRDGDDFIMIKDGGDLPVILDKSEDNYTEKTLAVSRVTSDTKDDGYRLCVKREYTTKSKNIETSYTIYYIDKNGIIKWMSSEFSIQPQYLDETQFNMDLTGDKVTSSGQRETKTVKSAAEVDPETKSKIEPDGEVLAEVDDNVVMQLNSKTGQTNRNTATMSLEQTSSEGLSEQLASDTGQSNLKPLTGVIDFSITISDENKYGTIVSLTWYLPDATNPIYLKKGLDGKFFNFKFNEATQEGYKWDAEKKYLTVYVKDNGQYDSNPELGVVRDPGTIQDAGVDTVKPTITLNGDASVIHEAGTEYTDTGAVATDNIDGNITVTTTGTVDVNTLGVYTIKYNASDSAGNAADEVTRTVTVKDTQAPIITLIGKSTVEVARNTTYTDAGATATDVFEGDLTTSIRTNNPIDTTTTPGTYTITYNVSDTSNNAATQVTRLVTVVASPDTTVPVITLTGDASITHEAGADYTDAGATVTDNKSSNLTIDTKFYDNNSKEVSIDTLKTTIGVYTIKYNTSDDAGNNAIEVTRTVTVVDTTIPVITPNGDLTVTHQTGTQYIDSGATASDTLDGAIAVDTQFYDNNGNVVLINTLKTTAGVYTVRYNATDANGNLALERIRIVTVVDTTIPVITINGESNLIHQAGTTYTDMGASVNEDIVVTTGTVDVNTLGVYTIKYNATDASGNVATERTRTVEVKDTVSPDITILGDEITKVEIKTPYKEFSVIAKDSFDGIVNVTASYTKDGTAVSTIDTNVKDVEYKVIYSAVDKSGNHTQVTRTVKIVDRKPQIQGPSGNIGDDTSSKVVNWPNIDKENIHIFTAHEPVSWSLSGGDDKDKFSIDPTTGKLSFNIDPHYENPSDSNSNNIYNVIIQATDLTGNSSQQNVNIIVKNIAYINKYYKHKTVNTAYKYVKKEVIN